jgi:hypothetical protein
VTHTFTFFDGLAITVDADKYPALVTAVRGMMLDPPASNREYMERFARLVDEMFGLKVPTETERAFVIALRDAGLISVREGGSSCA